MKPVTVRQTGYARIDRIVRRTALAIGLLTACAIPASFGTVAYLGDIYLQRIVAQLSAERIAQYAYVHGDTWRFSDHRIATLLDVTVARDGGGRQCVFDAQGNLVVSIGAPVSEPLLRVRMPILVQGKVQGYVEAESSLIPLFWRIGALASLGLTLGGAAYLTVNLLPLRALRRAVNELDTAHDDLRAQIVQTESALALARGAADRA